MRIDPAVVDSPDLHALAARAGEPAETCLARLLRLWDWAGRHAAALATGGTLAGVAAACGGGESFWRHATELGWLAAEGAGLVVMAWRRTGRRGAVGARSAAAERTARWRARRAGERVTEASHVTLVTPGDAGVTPCDASRDAECDGPSDASQRPEVTAHVTLTENLSYVRFRSESDTDSDQRNNWSESDQGIRVTPVTPSVTVAAAGTENAPSLVCTPSSRPIPASDVPRWRAVISPGELVRVERVAGELFRRTHYTGRDGRIFYQAAALVVLRRVSEAHVRGAAEATIAASRANPPGYFRTVLAESVGAAQLTELLRWVDRAISRSWCGPPPRLEPPESFESPHESPHEAGSLVAEFAGRVGRRLA